MNHLKIMTARMGISQTIPIRMMMAGYHDWSNSLQASHSKPTVHRTEPPVPSSLLLAPVIAMDSDDRWFQELMEVVACEEKRHNIMVCLAWQIPGINSREFRSDFFFFSPAFFHFSRQPT